MEPSTGTTYSYKRFVCADCGHRNLHNPAYPLVCPDCQSPNINEFGRRPEPIYAIEYAMKPYYCHTCHRKSLLSTAGPFLCPECRSDAVEEFSEQLKREDPHFQALLGHPKAEPVQQMEPASPFFDMISPFAGFQDVFSLFHRPRDQFRESFRRRGTPFTSRQTHLLGHFFDQIPGFDTLPSMQMFFGSPTGFPSQMTFEDLLQYISQQHPDSHHPASTETIQRLQVTQVNAEMVGEACAVCQEALREGEQVKVLPCKHVFHPGCIDPWLNVKNTCPVCRQEIG